MPSENDVKDNVDDVINTIDEQLREAGCIDPKLDGLKDELEGAINKKNSESGIPKGVSSDPPMNEYLLFITSHGEVGGRPPCSPVSYSVETSGIYFFRTRNMQDALAVAQAQIPHELLGKENDNNLGWMIHKDETFAKLIRKDDKPSVWDISVTETTTDELVRSLLRAVGASTIMLDATTGRMINSDSEDSPNESEDQSRSDE